MVLLIFRRIACSTSKTSVTAVNKDYIAYAFKYPFRRTLPLARPFSSFYLSVNDALKYAVALQRSFVIDALAPFSLPAAYLDLAFADDSCRNLVSSDYVNVFEARSPYAEM